MRRTFIAIGVLAFSLMAAAPSAAAVLCAKKSGVVVQRDACKKKETPVNVAELVGKVPSAATADAATNAIHAVTADDASNAATAQSLAAPEPFHLVGAPGEPGFQNSWANRGASFDAPAGFYKDAGGVVHLQGLVKGGMPNNSIFELPAGYRPADYIVVAAACECQASALDPQGGAVTVFMESGKVAIDGSNGSVTMYNATLRTDGTLSLDGITFRAGP